METIEEDLRGHGVSLYGPDGVSGISGEVIRLRECLTKKVSKTWLLISAASLVGFIVTAFGGPAAWTYQEIHRIDKDVAVQIQRTDRLIQRVDESHKEVQERQNQILAEIRALRK
jgi:hypothetical protein